MKNDKPLFPEETLRAFLNSSVPETFDSEAHAAFEASVLRRIAKEKQWRARVMALRCGVLIVGFLVFAWLGNHLTNVAQDRGLELFWSLLNSFIVLAEVLGPWAKDFIWNSSTLWRGMAAQAYPAFISILVAALLAEVLVCLNLNPKKLNN
jgi:hypothetical protein